MNHRHLICVAAWLLALCIGLSGSKPLLAQTPTPTLAPEETCPPEAAWLQHMVRPGDRWTTIAEDYGVSEADLRAANPSPLGLLRIGLPVRIPCVPGPIAPPHPTPRAAPTATSSSGVSTPTACTPPPGWSVRYTVQRGDTLSGLAAACRTSVALIRQANGCRTGDVIYAGETLLLPCRPASPATVTPARIQPSASPRAPAIPDLPPQPGPLGVALNPAHAVVGATIGVTIQDAGAREPLAVTVACGGQPMAAFSVTASGSGVATATFSTAGFPAGRCRVDVARTVVNSGGSARLTLEPAGAPSVQTQPPSSTAQTAAAGTPTSSLRETPTVDADAPPVTTSVPGPDAGTNTPDAPPTDTEGAEEAPNEQETPATPAPPTDATHPADPTDAAPPPEDSSTAPATSSPTSTLPPPTAPVVTSPPIITLTAPFPSSTPGDGKVGEPVTTQTVAPP